jgi:phosphate:Na+ symporter
MSQRTNPTDNINNIITLDPSALERPQRGLDCAARELLGIGKKLNKCS